MAGKAGKGMVAGLTAYFASGMRNTPKSLGEQIAEYIAMPSGQRPLTVALGLGTDGMDRLNETQVELQTQAIEMYGFGHLLKR